MKKHIFPLILLSIYIIIFIWSAINPADVGVWRVEAITSAISVVILLLLYIFKIRFSNLAYFMCAIFPIMHIIGAHFTFADVPFNWFNNLFGFERNMYDRVAHASVGLYSFLIIEMFLKNKLVNKKWVAYTYAIFFIMALALSYELFEWWYAISSDPNAGAEILGSQGDIWDAQKDMLMDTLGAIFGALIFFINNRNKRSIK